jgi:hypothetical protein
MPLPKPVLSGESDVLVAATEAAGEILLRQGREDEALKMKFDLLKAQAEAMAFRTKWDEAVAKYEQALRIKGVSAEERAECEKRLGEVHAMKKGRDCHAAEAR